MNKTFGFCLIIVLVISLVIVGCGNQAPAPVPAPEEGRVGLSFVPRGGEELLSALDKGSPVGTSLFEKFGSYARDVLFLVDGKRDVKTIAFLLGLPEYAIVEVLEFAITQRILAPTAV